jgi:hypothetical protein
MKRKKVKRIREPRIKSLREDVRALSKQIEYLEIPTRELNVQWPAMLHNFKGQFEQIRELNKAIVDLGLKKRE